MNWALSQFDWWTRQRCAGEKDQNLALANSLDNLRQLTARQREVLELLAQGNQVKVIAGRLEISESRVNQHIAKLKELLGTSDRIGFYEAWRQLAPCNDLQSINLQLHEDRDGPQMGGGSETGVFQFADVMPLRRQAPWEDVDFRIVPEALEGKDSGLRRLAIIVAVAMVLILGWLLLVGLYVGLTQAIVGRT